MMRKGKHAKPDRHILLKVAIGLLAVLFTVQILMLSDVVRSRLSIVDLFEGQSIGMESEKTQIK